MPLRRPSRYLHRFARARRRVVAYPLAPVPEPCHDEAAPNRAAAPIPIPTARRKLRLRCNAALRPPTLRPPPYLSAPNLHTPSGTGECRHGPVLSNTHATLAACVMLKPDPRRSAYERGAHAHVGQPKRSTPIPASECVAKQGRGSKSSHVRATGPVTACHAGPAAEGAQVAEAADNGKLDKPGSETTKKPLVSAQPGMLARQQRGALAHSGRHWRRGARQRRAGSNNNQRQAPAGWPAGALRRQEAGGRRGDVQSHTRKDAAKLAASEQEKIVRGPGAALPRGGAP